MVSGNEGVITRGCEVFVPSYHLQVPWHENLPVSAPDNTRVLSSALWLNVVYAGSFFSFVPDQLVRLAVWLSHRRDRIPLLLPSDAGRLKGFMYDWLSLFGTFEVVPYDLQPESGHGLSAPRFFVQDLHVVDWDAPDGVETRSDTFLLPPRWALQQLRRLAFSSVLGTNFEDLDGSGLANAVARTRVLVWIQRTSASARRIVNEDSMLTALQQVLDRQEGETWTIKIFSDFPSPPTAQESVRTFHSADIVVGVHGSGQANQLFCRQGVGVIDLNLPEPHSQYTAHNSYALDFQYRLVVLRGGLHQADVVSVPVDEVLLALKSLLPI